MPNIIRVLLLLSVCATTPYLVACQSVEGTPGSDKITGSDPQDVQYYPSDEPVRLGKQRFKEGAYGIAEHYFRDAVERQPRDLEAWLGLAASYDHLSRFDLADRAYAHAASLGGTTARLLNNEGYSFLLRGDLEKARAKFVAAARLDPTNVTIANNIRLLDGSRKYVRRDGEQINSDTQ
ncbi:tetratricopeptide repeat protein [Methylovirgula sp. 4M-Z18]|uniref:tetratricopeptide repeat protein n=1 Tax=Methylovirgula sp. 4M-Z18 TaxID=2293567 RepID=UPI000E2EEC0E|nr:tetratricopeptide repeat protein [Methylovirgula sp. 4M-Z18]RFB75502.1 tetratricopeptide repeat protein [Methylovirgula sp. 4M-Z18]